MHVSRRSFLEAFCGTATLLPLGMPAHIPAKRNSNAKKRGNILVVLELKGGNDGLNTVIPYTDPVYIKSRPTLHIKPDKVLKINSRFGFHPAMKALMDLFKKGSMSVIHGVGHEGLSQNHEEAMLTWQTAAPDNPNCPTGWLGRVIDRLAEEKPCTTNGVFVGTIEKPFTLRTEKTVVPRAGSPDALILQKAGRIHKTFDAPSKGTARDNPLLDFLSKATKQSISDSKRIKAALRIQNRSLYPPFQLANRLQHIASLIRAGTGTRIFYTDLGGGGFGGFDNHANQSENHAALLNQLSESVAAFINDLTGDGLSKKVLVATFSEFGRTVKENGRRGTGHGNAAPLLLAGGALKGGFKGKHPGLTGLRNGSQKTHIDFRRVYATVLDAWLGMDSRAILGKQFPHVPDLFLM